jgi:hypothetical protein
VPWGFASVICVCRGSGEMASGGGEIFYFFPHLTGTGGAPRRNWWGSNTGNLDQMTCSTESAAAWLGAQSRPHLESYHLNNGVKP